MEGFRCSELEDMLEKADLKFSREVERKSGDAKNHLRYKIEDERYPATEILIYGSNLKGWVPPDKDPSRVNVPKDLSYISLSVVKKVDFVEGYESNDVMKTVAACKEIAPIFFNDKMLLPYVEGHYIGLHLDDPEKVVAALGNLNLVAKIIDDRINTQRQDEFKRANILAQKYNKLLKS